MKKDKSKWERYAERYLLNKGYHVELIKQFNSKTKYLISKDGLTAIIELPVSVSDNKKYMDMIDDSFNMKIEIQSLKSKIS